MDKAHVHLLEPEQLPDSLLAHRSFSAKFSNCDHIGFRNFGERMGLPAQNRLRMKRPPMMSTTSHPLRSSTRIMSISTGPLSSTLRLSVIGIIALRPKEQMADIDASRIVAFVENEKRIIQSAMTQKPSDSVRLSRHSVKAKLSVSAIEKATHPRPALAKTGVMRDTLIGQRAVLVDLGPKPFLVRGREICEMKCGGRHNNDVLNVRAISELKPLRWLALFTPEPTTIQAT